MFQKTIKSVIISFSFIICKCCSLHYFIWSCGKTFLITTYFSVRFGPAALMRCVQLGNSTLLRFLILKVDSHLDQLIRIIRQYWYSSLHISKKVQYLWISRFKCDWHQPNKLLTSWENKQALLLLRELQWLPCKTKVPRNTSLVAPGALAHCMHRCTPHHLQNPKWPPVGPKMANGVWKGVYSLGFWAF